MYITENFEPFWSIIRLILLIPQFGGKISAKANQVFHIIVYDSNIWGKTSQK